MTSRWTRPQSATGELRQPGLWWILAFAATAGVGWVVNWEPIVQLREPWFGVAIYGGWVALAALVASLLQAALLGLSVGKARAWIPCSLVGALVGYACIFVGTPLANLLVDCSLGPGAPEGWQACSPSQDTLRAALVFALAGATFGAVQAIVLCRWVSQAWLCIPFTAAALAAARVILPMPLVGHRLLPQVLMVWGAGAAGGLIKGAGLAFLLRVHRRSPPTPFSAWRA